MKKNLWLPITVFVLFLAMIACVSPPSKEPEKGTISEKDSTSRKDSSLETFELDFTDLLTGTLISMRDLRGKVVVIDFWASWCPPCIDEVPKMKALYAQFRNQGVEFIGISLDSQSSTVVEFCRANGMDWPQYCEDGKTWNTEFSTGWGINSIPRIFLIDQNGYIYSKEARGQLDTLIPQVLALGN
jgi:thiol-disulfide isomerase/thioredoxin